MGVDLVASLGGLLGPEAVVEEPGREDALGRIWISPSSPDEAARVLALASEEGWSVLPVGAAQWRDGAPVSGDGGAALYLSTRRMTRVLEYEPGDMTLTVEAGATLASIQERVRQNGQWLPLDPPPDDAGTLGATLATGSLGPLAHGFGGPRDLTLGLALATGDGRLLALGGRVVKNVAGFDLVRLMVGSWGAIGLITSATIRLFPVPESQVVLVRTGRDAAELDAVAREVALGRVEPAAIQVATLDDESFVSVRLLGAAEEVDDVAAGVAAIATGWTRLEGDDARDRLARLRSAEAGADVALRLSLLPSKVARARQLLAAFGEHLGSRDVKISRIVFDAASGVFRVGLTCPPIDRVLQASTELAAGLQALRSAVEAEGGSVRVIHGPVAVRTGSGAWGARGPERHLLAGLLSAFDPHGVLPGERFVP